MSDIDKVSVIGQTRSVISRFFDDSKDFDDRWFQGNDPILKLLTQSQMEGLMCLLRKDTPVEVRVVVDVIQRETE